MKARTPVARRPRRPALKSLVLLPAPPRPPWRLSKAARAQWDRLLAVLLPSGILAPIDADSLASWAETLVHYHRANQELEKAGPLIEIRRGRLIANPILAEIRHHLIALQRFQAAFGCSPSDRIRGRRRAPQRPHGPIEVFLSQGPSL